MVNFEFVIKTFALYLYKCEGFVRFRGSYFSAI